MTKMLPLYIISGIVGLIALYAGLTGKKIFFISDARVAVILLTAVGFLMCSLGGIGVFVTKAPVHPLTITGYILGGIALIVGIIQIFKLKVPLLGDPRNALILIMIIIIIKFVIARLSFLLPVK